MVQCLPGRYKVLGELSRMGGGEGGRKERMRGRKGDREGEGGKEEEEKEREGGREAER